jgi:hypothetical protein
MLRGWQRELILRTEKTFQLAQMQLTLVSLCSSSVE